MQCATQPAQQVNSSNADGLAPGSVIPIDASDPERREIVSIAAIAPSGGPADWARVATDVPLALDHLDPDFRAEVDLPAPERMLGMPPGRGDARYRSGPWLR